MCQMWPWWIPQTGEQLWLASVCMYQICGGALVLDSLMPLHPSVVSGLLRGIFVSSVLWQHCVHVCGECTCTIPCFHIRTTGSLVV